MNPEAREELDRILEQNPESLSEYDRNFLNARREYLNNEQKRVFSSVLLTDEQVRAIQNPEEEKEEAPLYVAKKDRVNKEDSSEDK